MFRDIGMTAIDEPFTRLLTQGMVLNAGQVMSKSKGNVVDPDDMIQKFGADALRLYVMFVAPPEKEIEWTDAGLEGSFRFLARVWRLVDQLSETIGGEGIPGPGDVPLDDRERALRRKTHETIRRVTLDLDPRVHLNTAVSALMELVNELYGFCGKSECVSLARPADDETAVGAQVTAGTVAVLKEAVEALVLMISPFAPHMAEELWELLGHRGGVTAAGWPQYQEDVARASEITVPVQVNGKVRVPSDGAGGHRRGRPAGGGAAGSAGRPLHSRARPSARSSSPAAQPAWSASLCPDAWIDAISCSAGLAALALPGCGYSLSGRGSFLPASIKIIGVPLFTNTTSLYEIEQRVTDRVRAELIGRAAGPSSRTSTDVDALLTGEIAAATLAPCRLQRAAAGHAAGADPRRPLELRDVKANKVIWAPGHAVQRDIRGLTPASAGIPTPSCGRTPTRSTGSPREFARAVVSAMLEAF